MTTDPREPSEGSETPTGTGVTALEPRPDGGRPRLDAVLDALANRRRRYALYYLQECTTATIAELAEQVAAWERDRPVTAVEIGSSDRIYADFYHHHLPKLVDANMIDYDPRKELARYDCSDLVEGVLEVARWVESPEEN